MIIFEYSFVGVIKKNVVFATYLADQHLAGANIKHRNLCVCMRLSIVRKSNVNQKKYGLFIVRLSHFRCAAVNSVASDSQICRIYYFAGFFLALSHFESRRRIFFFCSLSSQWHLSFIPKV